MFSVSNIFKRIQLSITIIDPIAVRPANVETKTTFNGSSTKALELACSTLRVAFVMSIDTTVASDCNVAAAWGSVVVSTLDVDVTNTILGSSIDVIVFVVPNGAVDDRIVVFAVTVFAPRVIILEDACNLAFVVVDISYTVVISSIDEDTYVSGVVEIVVIFDAFDDLHVAVLVCCDAVAITDTVPSEY